MPHRDCAAGGDQQRLHGRRTPDLSIVTQLLNDPALDGLDSRASADAWRVARGSMIRGSTENLQVSSLASSPKRSA